MRFSAAVLIGGRSRRMGRDKWSLPAPPHRTLLERQLAILRETRPCELLVSARIEQDLSPAVLRGDVVVVRDDGAAGPLGGLVAVLRATRAPRVLVLGVDVAAIDAAMLRRVLGAAPDDREDGGIIPEAAGHPQPLAAMWPVALRAAAENQLAAGADLSLRTLVRAGLESGALRTFSIPSWDEPRFHNWNTRADLPSR